MAPRSGCGAPGGTGTSRRSPSRSTGCADGPELDGTEIAHRLGASVATTSHHLGPLRRAGLVTSRRDGTRTLNRIAGPHVLDLCAAACATANRPTHARRPDPTMTTTAPATHHQAPPVPEWTGAAVAYDAWFDRQWGHHAFAVESAAVMRAAGAIAGTRVLDADCGTGRFSAALAAGDASVVAVDPDPGMLEVARDRLPGGCARAAVEHLPFPDDAFDLTLAVTVLEFVADPAIALAELARVTSDGGRIVIGALNPHSPWGLANRRRLRAGVWCHARFLSPRALRTLGALHGESAVHGALYAPGAFPGLTVVGPFLERAARLAPRWGAFQVLGIDKHPQR